MRKDFGAKPILYPQPVVIVGTYNEDGTANAMNAAWVGICGQKQIIMHLSAGHKTTANIKREGAFTVSVADAAHVTEADYLGIASGNKVPDKLEKCVFHTIKSAYVNAPIIEELPMALECKLEKITEYGIVGEIVNVSVDERVVTEDGGIDVKALAAIAFDPVNNAYLKVDENSVNQVMWAWLLVASGIVLTVVGGIIYFGRFCRS